MKKRHIAVFTGGRFEYGIMRPVIKQIQASENLDMQLVVSGLHLLDKYGSTIDLIKKDGLPIAYTAKFVLSEKTKGKVSLEISKGVAEFTRILLKLKPDIVVVIGDRAEAFAFAVAAAFIPIPVAHIHGGDLSMAGFDETIRHAITKISHIHFAATKKSKERILQMGENPKNVFLVGAPGLDDLIKEPVLSKYNLEKHLGVKIPDILIVILQHPVSTSPETSKKEIRQTLIAASRLPGLKILIYPNGDAGSDAIISEYKKYRNKKDFLVVKNIDRNIYANILRTASLMMGNSSGGIIETASFGLPVINIGIRQLGRDRNDNVVDVPYNSVQIEAVALKILNANKKYKMKNIYGDGTSAKRIVSVLEKVKIDFDLIQKHFYEKN